MSDRPMPCLVLPGPPKVYLWPKVTMDVNGIPVTVDILGCIEKDEPFWFVLDIMEGDQKSPVRPAALGMPVLPITKRDLRRPDMVARMLKKLHRMAA